MHVAILLEQIDLAKMEIIQGIEAKIEAQNTIEQSNMARLVPTVYPGQEAAGLSVYGSCRDGCAQEVGDNCFGGQVLEEKRESYCGRI